MKTTLLSFILAALSVMGLSAQTFTENGIKYNITDAAGNTVEVIAGVNYTGNITLPSVTVNNGVTYSVTAIGNQAFQYCSNMTSITIPGSITRIGESAFAECYKLSAIAIPASVTNISEGAFSNCQNVTQFTVDVANTSYSSVNGALFDKNQTILLAYPMASSSTQYTVPSTVTAIGKNVFYNNSKLTEVTLPAGLTAVNDYGFYYASKLATLNIPATVSSIGQNAFNNSLWYQNYYNSQPDGMIFINQCLYAYKGALPANSDIVVPNGTNQIGAGVFKNASGLKTISIPEGIKSIGERAFQNCTNLMGADIPNSVTHVGQYAFENCSSLQSVLLSNNLIKLEEGIFSRCTALADVTIPSSVTSIGSGVFAASGLTSVILPASVTSMGDWNFDGCDKLTSATILGNISKIGDFTFQLCTSLTSVTLSGSITSIGKGAFDNCSGLTSIILPGAVTFMGDNAFYNCKGLTQIRCNAQTPPALGNMVFGNVNPNTCKLIVPENSTTAYQAADQWKDFKEIIGTPTSILSEKGVSPLFNILPNPALDYFVIQGLEKETLVSVYDVFGKMVLEKRIFPNEKISVIGWNKGIYFVKIGNRISKLIVR